MKWDVLITAGIGLAQLIITWYAVDISVRDRRTRNAFTIGTVGALGVALTIWGAIRNGTAQSELNERLTKIQQNTEKPPQVTVNVPQSPAPKIIWKEGDSPRGWLSVSEIDFPPSLDTHPFSVNVHLKNVGQGPLSEVRFWEIAEFLQVGIIRSAAESENLDQKAYAGFLELGKKEIKAAEKSGSAPTYFGVNDDRWGTMVLNPQKEEIDGVMNGTVRLYFFAYAEWRGGRSTYVSCQWLQPPAKVNYGGGANLVLHYCG